MEYNVGNVGDLVRCGYAGIWEISKIEINKANGKDWQYATLKLLCNSKFRFAKKRREIVTTSFWKISKEDMEATKKMIEKQLQNVNQIIRMLK